MPRRTCERKDRVPRRTCWVSERKIIFAIDQYFNFNIFTLTCLLVLKIEISFSRTELISYQ